MFPLEVLNLFTKTDHFGAITLPLCTHQIIHVNLCNASIDLKQI